MKAISRREFFRLSTLAVAAVAAEACAAPAPTAEPTNAPVVATKVPESAGTVAPQATAAPVSKFQEAPMLAELVKAGTLPPVEQRLPLNPWVCPKREILGNYGGVIRMVYSSGNEWHIREFLNHQFIWYDPNMVMKPHLCESFEISPDGKEWTFRLRKGTKWSDGTPHTAQDYTWWHENVILNPELTASVPGTYRSQDAEGNSVPCKCEAPDDVTVKYIYASPVPLKGYDFTKTYGVHEARPSHYLKQWHLDFVDDKEGLQKAAKDAGFDKWTDFFQSIKENLMQNPERPSVMGWIPGSIMRDQLFRADRNPYFYGVDEEGNQLPYVDQLQWRSYESWETAKLWMMGGEVDMWPVDLRDIPSFQENEAKHGCRMVMVKEAQHMGIELNMTCKDKRLREFFQKREVRLAVSHAVDRDELNDVIYFGRAVPRQYSPVSSSPLFYDKASFSHIEFDLNMANDLLDQAGYKEKNSDGFRVWPGTQEPIGWIVETNNDPNDALEMVCKHLEKVGLKVSSKVVTKPLYHEHVNTNEVQAGNFGGDRCLIPLLDPAIFYMRMYDRPVCPAWSIWYSNPDDPNAEEPPKDHFIWKIWDLASKISVEASEEVRNTLFRQVLDIWIEELPQTAFVGDWDKPILMKKGLRNYPEGTPLEWATGYVTLADPEQWTWEDPTTQSANAV